MKVSISRTKIEKDGRNEVSSPFILEPHRRRTSENLKFDDKGIFSKRIFGNLYRCDCGRLTEEGFCNKCGTRVISTKNMPEFYIDLKIHVAAALADFENALTDISSDITADDLKDIMEYKKFVYEGKVYELDEEDTSFESRFDSSKVKIGIDALSSLGVSAPWIKENTTDCLNVPHTMYRPIVIDNRNMPYITNINALYSNILEKINRVIELGETYSKERPFFLMIQYQSIVEIYNEIIQKLFDELQNVKYSIIKSEVISHPISGAIRAVLTNRHDLDEDVLLIGDTLIETLYPYLYKKHKGDMVAINQELVDEDYVVLFNRPPTISHLSIIAMRPRVASIYPFGKLYDSDRGLKHNYRYVEENRENIGIFKDRDGDIEKFIGDIKDGIDTVGVRAISVNPIAMDGLAGDFDGDVLLVIALYSRAAIEEAKAMLPSRSFTNYANGTIRNHIIEDFIFTDNDDE